MLKIHDKEEQVQQKAEEIIDSIVYHLDDYIDPIYNFEAGFELGSLELHTRELAEEELKNWNQYDERQMKTFLNKNKGLSRQKSV